VDGQRPAARRRFVDQHAQHARPDAPPAERRRERDVHDPDVSPAAVHVQPPGGFVVDLDDVERRTGVVLPVVRVLRR
jgi:hypothetical protein